jgi:hypothetical protein
MVVFLVLQHIGGQTVSLGEKAAGLHFRLDHVVTRLTHLSRMSLSFLAFHTSNELKA